MTVYPLDNIPNQTFQLRLAGALLDISLQKYPRNGWVLSTPDFKGVRVVPNIPILNQYGYPQLYFFTEEGDNIVDLTLARIVVFDEDELNELSNTINV